MNSILFKNIDIQIQEFTKVVVAFAEIDDLFVDSSTDDYASNFGRKSLMDKKEYLTNETNGLSELFKDIKNGHIYYSQFYMTGFYYLSILFLGGFQGIISEAVTFTVLALMSIFYMGYIYICVKGIQFKCKQPIIKPKRLKAWFALLYIPIFIFSIFLISYLERYFSIEYLHVINNFKLPIFVISFFYIFLPLSNIFFFGWYYESTLKKKIRTLKDGDDMKAVQAYYASFFTKGIKNIQL